MTDEVVESELAVALRETADDMIEAIGRACNYVTEEAAKVHAAAKDGKISEGARNYRIAELTMAWSRLGELLAGCPVSLDDTAAVVRLLVVAKTGTCRHEPSRAVIDTNPPIIHCRLCGAGFTQDAWESFSGGGG